MNMLLKDGVVFQRRACLGGVPIVPPGSYEPFAMFWYLPVNPQIPIDYVKPGQQQVLRPPFVFRGHRVWRPAASQGHMVSPTVFAPQRLGSKFHAWVNKN